MRKTNKRIQRTVEELWAENTDLLKDLNKNEPGEKVHPNHSKTKKLNNSASDTSDI